MLGPGAVGGKVIGTDTVPGHPLTSPSASRASGVSWGTAGPNGALPDVCYPPQDLPVSITRREPGPQAGICLWGDTAASAPEDPCRASPEQPQP